MKSSSPSIAGRSRIAGACLLCAGSIGLAGIASAQASGGNIPGQTIVIAQLAPQLPPSQQSGPFSVTPGRQKPGLKHALAFGCGAGAGLSPEQQKLNLTLSCNFRPLKRLSLGAGIAIYPIPGQQALSDSDFNLQASYDLIGRIKLEYASYAGNRWDTLSGRELAGGSLFLSDPLPTPWAKAHAPAILRSLACSVAVGRPLLRLGQSGSTRGAVSCGANLTSRLNLRLTANVYPPGQEKAYDPDFTYAITYRLGKKINVGYANYSGNRWFGRGGGNGGLQHGTLFVSYALPMTITWSGR